MKLVAILGGLTALAVTLAAPAGSEPAPAPAAAGGLREAPAEKQEALRDRRLQVTLFLKEGDPVQGILESYAPGKEGHPGTFALGLEGDKTKMVYEEDVARVEVGEAVKDARPVKHELPPELLEAIRAGKTEQFIEKHRAVLKKAGTIPQGRWELFLLRVAYQQHLKLEKKPLKDRLQADVDTVESEPIRTELHKILQDERMWGKPLRPGPGRGLGPDKPPEKP
jgi:hypothetical protein